MSNVTKLITPLNEHMTIKQVQQAVQSEDWENMIVIGYHKDRDDFVTRCSEMSRQDALWLTEQLKKHVLNF